MDPMGVHAALAEAALHESGEQVDALLAACGGRGGPDCLYGDEVLLGDERRVDGAGGDHPFAGRVPAQHLPISAAGIGGAVGVWLGVGEPVPVRRSAAQVAALFAGLCPHCRDGPNQERRTSRRDCVDS